MAEATRSSKVDPRLRVPPSGLTKLAGGPHTMGAYTGVSSVTGRPAARGSAGPGIGSTYSGANGTRNAIGKR